jgi:hypothetical protein
MTPKNYFIILIATTLFIGCNGKKSDDKTDSEKTSFSSISGNVNTKDKGLENEKCNCNSVEDCLDKNDFECAREFCSDDKNNCDRKKIIEIESLYWLNQNSYSRSKKIALEIFSVKEMDEIQKNNWYAEKLSDIINAMVNDNKIGEAEIMASDFPIEIKGDDTYKFKIDALNSIADAYTNANMKREKAMIQNKIAELKKSKEVERKIRESQNKSKILDLEKEIKQLLIDQKEKAKLIKKEIAELSTNLKDEKKRLEAIRKDFYIIQSNRKKDIDNQTSVINQIENKIENLKSDLLEGNNLQITTLKEQIRELKLNNN